MLSVKKRETVGLVTLSFFSAVFCWLAAIQAPGLELPWWLPLCCVGLSAALSSLLNQRFWRVFATTTTVGTVAGLCAGFARWWPRDPIAGPWVPIVAFASMLAAAIIATFSAWMASRSPVFDEKLRRAAWVALMGIAAFGPVCLSVTPSLVARRLTRSEQTAADRFESLHLAVKQTVATRSDPAMLCAGPLVARNYFGPPFSSENWLRITGNYVRQDGYLFMIYCREGRGYTIDVHPADPYPARQGQKSLRRFCVDESGKVGCEMKWDRSRHACLPCSE